MDHSENINEIASALAKAQEVMESPPKDKQGHNYRYASLDACMAVLKKCLPQNGLAISQTIKEIDGKNFVKTFLMHTSGQWISSEIPLDTQNKMSMSNMQKVGTAITYARRYALAIVGLTPDEDTDNADQAPRVFHNDSSVRSNITVEMIEDKINRMCKGDVRQIGYLKQAIKYSDNDRNSYNEGQLKYFNQELEKRMNS